MNRYSIANSLKLVSDEELSNGQSVADPELVMQEQFRRKQLRGSSLPMSEGGILDLVKPEVQQALQDPRQAYAAMLEQRKRAAGGRPTPPPLPPLMGGQKLSPAVQLQNLQQAPTLRPMAAGGIVDLYGFTDSKHKVDGMNEEFRNRLLRMYGAMPEHLRPRINSGYRDNQRQAEIYADAVKKYGSPEAARKWAAPPGRSFHNKGYAADLGYGNDEARAWAHANAAKYGLSFPMKHEPWHIEMAGVRGGQQPAAQPSSTGQPAPQPTQTASPAPQPNSQYGNISQAPNNVNPMQRAMMTHQALGMMGVPSPFGQMFGQQQSAPAPAPAPAPARMEPPQENQYEKAEESRRNQLMAQRNAMLAQYSMG